MKAYEEDMWATLFDEIQALRTLEERTCGYFSGQELLMYTGLKNGIRRLHLGLELISRRDQ